MNYPAPYATKAVTDRFLPASFPEIDIEISMIKMDVGDLRTADNCSVMISYFRDHKIRMDIAQSQSVLIDILLSMRTCHHIKSLFDASRESEQFSAGLESYLIKELTL